MTNYSIRYLDATGQGERFDDLPFDDNQAAVDFARIGLTSHAIAEVWKDDDLVIRLHRDAPPVPGSAPASRKRLGLKAFDNEGGAKAKTPSDIS